MDDALLEQVRARVIDGGETAIELRPNAPLNNRNKPVGGQLGVDIERMLNRELETLPNAAFEDVRGRRYLDMRTVRIVTQGSAGQSFGAFCNDGMALRHDAPLSSRISDNSKIIQHRGLSRALCPPRLNPDSFRKGFSDQKEFAA